MSQVLERFTISLDIELLAAFDDHIVKSGYTNRSEAVRDLIRDRLLFERISDEAAEVSGFFTAICDQRNGGAIDRVRGILAESAALVLGVLSRPLDAHREMLAVMMSGPASEVQALANGLRALRGVSHGHLALTSSVATPSP